MKPLNQDFAFDQLPAKERSEFLAAFFETPKPKLFLAGTKFFRFVTPQKGETPKLKGNGILDAAWWFDKDTHTHVSKLAHKAKTSLAHAARSSLAITQRFNSEMEYLCAIRLTAPVYGWVGRARWQEDVELQLCYPGGSPQVYFPSLATRNNGLSSAVAKLEMWGFLDDAV